MSNLISSNSKENSNIENYFLKNSLKIAKNADPFQNKKNFHSDLFYKMNSHFINPKTLNDIEDSNNMLNCQKGEKNEKDLDYYMNKKIKQNLEKQYHSKKFQQINQNFSEYLKKEEFDKKEFTFGRKMLLMKKREVLGEKSNDLEDFANDLKINKDLKTEAEVN